MPLQTNKARLIWRSRRGMLELDILLSRFIEKAFGSLTEEQCEAYEHLLTHTDPDLFNWLMGYEIPEEKECQAIVAFIRNHHSV